MSSSSSKNEMKSAPSRGKTKKTPRKPKSALVSAADGTLFNTVGRPQAVAVKSQNNTIHRFVQTYEVGAAIVSSTSVPVFDSFSFNVNNLDQISSLTSVFDQYKIEMVEIWAIPRVSTPQSTSANFGSIASVLDFDDANALSTYASALDYTNAVVCSGTEGFYRCFKPHIAVAAYSGAFTSFANQPPQWIDAASTTVQHYGLKTAWTMTDSVYTYDLVVRLHTAWRNIR